MRACNLEANVMSANQYNFHNTQIENTLYLGPVYTKPLSVCSIKKIRHVKVERLKSHVKPTAGKLTRRKNTHKLTQSAQWLTLSHNLIASTTIEFVYTRFIFKLGPNLCTCCASRLMTTSCHRSLSNRTPAGLMPVSRRPDPRLMDRETPPSRKARFRQSSMPSPV